MSAELGSSSSSESSFKTLYLLVVGRGGGVILENLICFGSFCLVGVFTVYKLGNLFGQLSD